MNDNYSHLAVGTDIDSFLAQMHEAEDNYRTYTFIIYEGKLFRDVLHRRDNIRAAIEYVMSNSGLEFCEAMNQGWHIEAINEVTGHTTIIKSLRSALA